MNDIMIDLETMGRPPRAVIVSIGAVYFDRLVPGKLGAQFYRVVDMNSCISVGLEFDAGTIEWWLGQHSDARAAIFRAPAHLSQVLADLWKFFGPPSVRDTLRFWGNGPTFDLMNLRSAFAAVGYDGDPWHYRQERCVRTVVGAYLDAWPGTQDDTSPKAQFEGAADAHNALADAITQAKYVSTMYEDLVVGARKGTHALQREEERRGIDEARDEILREDERRRMA